MHLADDRLLASPEAHEAGGVLAHDSEVEHGVPASLVRVGFFGVKLEVVARAKGSAGAAEDDHVHGVVAIGLLDGGPQLTRHLVVDGVKLFWSV
jgi:hypothetical protein